MLQKRRTFIQGFLLGLVISFVGYFLVTGGFFILTSFGLMEEVSASTVERRFRTITLIAICLNIFPVHYYRSRGSEQFLRGIITAVFLYIIIWIIYFSSSLLLTGSF